MRTSARLSMLSVLVAIGTVADQDGVVRWFSISRNFQVRPDPGDVLRAVRAL